MLLCKIQQNQNSMKKKALSIYWDYQNVRVNRSNPNLAQDVLSFAKSLGRLVLQRVYANWRQEKQDREHDLYKLGYDCIDIPTTAKQSVDQKLIVDCEKGLNLTGGSNILILISGDKDFIKIVQKWKTKGKKVIIFAGSKNYSKKLIDQADEYYFIDKELPNISSQNKLVNLA